MQAVSTFRIAPKIIFGSGSIRAMAREIKFLGKKVFIVLDPSIEGPPSLFENLKKEGISFEVFRDLAPEPWVENADKAAESLKRSSCDCVAGIGGGSAMDIAKAAAALATNPGSAADYQGLNLLKNPALAKIMAPTTSGTGSEATFTAVLSKKEPPSKAGINSPFLFPETAVLDPEMTLNLPAFQTATTGMDALTHAIEAYTSLNAGPLSDLAAYEAIKLIAVSLERAVSNGGSIGARTDMMMGSLLGGIALANAGVGAVHALSYPLGGAYRIPHGVANGLLLTYVMEYNAQECPGKYSEIARIFSGGGKGESAPPAREAAPAVRELARKIGVPLKLSEIGIKKENFPEMAEAAMKVTRPLENNPRSISAEEATLIYNRAY